MRFRLGTTSKLALLILALLLPGCGKSKEIEKPEILLEKPSTVELAKRPPARPQDYVGSQACAECHSDIARDYFGSHPMGRSLRKVAAGTPIEDYTAKTTFETAKLPRSPVTISYKIEKDGDAVLHHEIATRDDGEVVYDCPVPVDYAVGSGERGISYFINHSGLLYMSPVTWYSGAKRWDLSPGYGHRNLHFGRRIIDGCVNCHVGRMARVEATTDIYKPEPFLEESIGCERCHGPGERHVALYRNGKAGGKDPIVNPADLEPRLRDSVCLQCHLIGEHRLTRYGRTDFDFRPGDDVSDIWTIFLKEAAEEKDRSLDAVSQAEQMLSSVCYQKSEGRLGCISCHDPHKLPSEEDRVAFYRKRCLECHGPDQTECSQPVAERLKVSAEDSCIACHMPRVAANDVPHTSQTDHRVLRKYQAKKPPKEPPPQALYVFRGGDGVIPEPELIRAQAISLIRMAEQRGNKVLAVDAIRPLKKWLESAPDDLEARIALGIGYWLSDDIRQAAQVWQEALKQAPDEEKVLRRLFMLCHESQRYEKGVEYGRKLVKINAWDSEYWGRMSHMLAQLGRFQESAEAAKKAIDLNPAGAGVYHWLADVYGALHDPKQSEHYRRLYEKLTKP